jgi:hypothetical protein
MSFVSSTDSIMIKPNSGSSGSSGTITLDTNNSSGNGNIYLKTNGGNNVTINSNNLTISTVNPPTQSAVQPNSNDSSNKIPTTAWVQSAISSGSSLSVYSVSYTSNQTVVTPTNCRYIDIQLIGYGGNAGVNAVGPPVYYGGSGSGGNLARISGCPMEGGVTLTLTFNSTSTTGFSQLQYTNASGVLVNLARVYNGSQGDNGVISGNAAGATPNTTASLVNTTLGTWFSAFGTAGLPSTTSGGGNSVPPALTGTGNACPSGTFSWVAGKRGCGGRIPGDPLGGIITITYHKA